MDVEENGATEQARCREDVRQPLDRLPVDRAPLPLAGGGAHDDPDVDGSSGHLHALRRAAVGDEFLVPPDVGFASDDHALGRIERETGGFSPPRASQKQKRNNPIVGERVDAHGVQSEVR